MFVDTTFYSNINQVPGFKQKLLNADSVSISAINFGAPIYKWDSTDNIWLKVRTASKEQPNQKMEVNVTLGMLNQSLSKDLYAKFIEAISSYFILNKEKHGPFDELRVQRVLAPLIDNFSADNDAIKSLDEKSAMITDSKCHKTIS